MAVAGSAVSGAAAKAAVDAPMADTINASASIKLQTVFFFMLFYSPFLLFGCVSTMSVAYQGSSWISPAKVQGKCHKFVTAPVLYKEHPPGSRPMGVRFNQLWC
jgi:hypothetical protein